MNVAAAAHIAAKLRLQAAAAAAAAAVWDGLPAYDRENVDQFLVTALPLLEGANVQSVALTEVYLAHVLGRQPLGVDAAAVVAGIRDGAAPADVYSRPFVTVWSALSRGTPFDEAVRFGRERAQSAAAMDVQLAFRDTIARVGEADDRIMGFRRVANGGACAFCREVDGAQFRTETPMPLHNGCGCGVEVVEYTRGRRRELTPTSTPETVAVHEHGELGPVLADPAHDFTTVSQLAA